jgi:hypothetical protein
MEENLQIKKSHLDDRKAKLENSYERHFDYDMTKQKNRVIEKIRSIENESELDFFLSCYWMVLPSLSMSMQDGI